jgi:hypothetical protein
MRFQAGGLKRVLQRGPRQEASRGGFRGGSRQEASEKPQRSLREASWKRVQRDGFRQKVRDRRHRRGGFKGGSLQQTSKIESSEMAFSQKVRDRRLQLGDSRQETLDRIRKNLTGESGEIAVER